MTPEEAKLIKVNETIIGNDSDASRWNHVRSSFRVTAILPNGLQLRRIHASYLTEGPIETWVARWDQLRSFTPLPNGIQIPLL